MNLLRTGTKLTIWQRCRIHFVHGLADAVERHQRRSEQPTQTQPATMRAAGSSSCVMRRGFAQSVPPGWSSRRVRPMITRTERCLQQRLMNCNVPEKYVGWSWDELDPYASPD